MTISELYHNGVVVENGYVYLDYLYNDEVLLATRIKEIQNATPKKTIKVPDGTFLSAMQKSAIQTVADNQVSIITGSPGVGKTVTAVEIVRAARGAGAKLKIMAPTGKAAARLQEALGEGDIFVAGMAPTTIHRGLEWVIYDENDTKGQPRKNVLNPIDADLIIVDELSMCDLSLMAALFNAIEPGTKVVLIGDINQLPPVGPGQPFIDMVKSGAIPVTQLVDVFRQARGSKIWLACQAILEESPYKFFNLAPKDGDEIAYNPLMASDEIAAFFKRGIKGFIEKGGDPFDQLQLLTPIREKGPASVVGLNLIASKLINIGKKNHLNLANQGKGYEGDKVSQLKNNYIKQVFNGDQGRIRKVGRLPIMVNSIKRGKRHITWSRWPEREEKASEWPALSVDIGGANHPYDEEEALEQLMLSYAITVHRSQGSQWPRIAIALPSEAYGMLGRRLLLTAVSRARKRVVIAGSSELLSKAITTDRDSSRRGGLIEKLKG